MGIDLYLKWADQTEDEKKAQITGFSDAGAAGYIREAYHGAPYATRMICEEAFSDAAWPSNSDIENYDDLPEYESNMDLAGCRVVAAEQLKEPLFPGQPVIDTIELEQRKKAAVIAAELRGMVTYDGDAEYGKEHARHVGDFIDKAIELAQSGKTVIIYASY